LKYFIFIIVGVLIFPLILKGYFKYVPGNIIGSIDGWLSFLGGVTGGLLSFLAAVTIFNNQRKDNVRPFINSSPEARNPNAKQCLYSLKNENVTIDPVTYKTSDSTRHERFIDFAIKNIGVGPALDITVFDSKNKKLALADLNLGVFQEFHALTHLEVGESKSWVVCLDLNVAKNNDSYFETWNLQYKDILNNIYTLDLHVFFNKEHGKASISIKI
jgi:hypothetical protein